MFPDKNILSIDSEDDDKNYEAFSEYLENDTKEKKAKAFLEIEEFGKQYLKEIDRKNKDKKLKSNKLIPYILKHCDGKYNKKELQKYSYEDVQEIYKAIKTRKRPAIVKFFYFLFNL